MRTARHRAPATGWGRAGTELSRLVLPVYCAGCGRPDSDLCRQCLRALTGPARYVADLVGAAPAGWQGSAVAAADPPLLAVAEFGGVVREALVAWKDDGRADLTPVVAAALARALSAAAGAAVTGAAADARRGSPLLVVPVPSTASAVRRRGADLVAAASRDAVHRNQNRQPSRPLVVAVVLRHRGRVRDQSGLGAAARAENVSGRMVCRADLRGRDVVLVDDVVTTGATLAEAARAVQAGGGRPVAATVVAATRRRDRR